MLKIQEFIQANDNWEQLLAAAPYNLTIKWDDGFVLFKYNQISSDFSQDICKEARGLILDSTQNFKVVRFAFGKFFNLGESFAAQIDWDTAVSNEKIDGSLMSVWYARGKWHLSTNGTIDAFKAEINGVGPYKNFGELFESVLPLSWFTETLSSYFTHICYTFELVSPYTQIVLSYPETKVFLLSTRNMDTLEEYPLDETAEFAKRFDLTMPQFYYMNDEAGFKRLVDSFDETHEGIVVRDARGQRIKLKTPFYFELHRMAGNGKLTAERALHLVRTNEVDEFLAYFGQYKDYIAKIKDFYNQILSTLAEVELEVKRMNESNKMPRKEFAEFAKKKDYPFLYFKAYDAQDLKSYIENLTDVSFLKMFKFKES